MPVEGGPAFTFSVPGEWFALLPPGTDTGGMQGTHSPPPDLKRC